MQKSYFLYTLKISKSSLKGKTLIPQVKNLLIFYIHIGGDIMTAILIYTSDEELAQDDDKEE